MNDNTNSIPQLIISFVALTGAARVALQKYVQEELFKRGFRWAGGEKYPCYEDTCGLMVGSRDWNKLEMTYFPNVPRQECFSTPTRIFDATKEIEEFLLMAQGLTEYHTEVRGVSVVITPTEVKLDTTAFLELVAADARRLQSQRFGVPF